MSNAVELLVVTQATNASALNERRGRELYRYFQPENLLPPQLTSRFGSEDVDLVGPDLNNGLAPFVQLAALCCGAQKAMLNFMDKDVMYFLAEARRAQQGDEVVEDVIFLGCSGVPLAGRICEMTVHLDGKEDHPMFVVPNLEEDKRFASLPIVKEAPFYRFYAGTPITTPNGVHIGSLAIMDLKERPGLTEFETKTLGETAGHIMSYLEIHRQAIEGRRARRMGQGFDYFVAGKKTLIESIRPEVVPERKLRAGYGLSLPIHGEDLISSSSRSPKARKACSHRVTQSSQSSGSTESDSHASDESGSDESTNTEDFLSQGSDSDSRSHTRTFARAANLIRESFELGDDGGVQFYCVKSGLQTRTALRDGRGSKSPTILSTPLPVVTFTSFADSDERKTHIAPILASSTSIIPWAEENDAVNSRSRIGEDFLLQISKRYPAGRLWSFSQNSKLSSDEDIQNFPHPSERRRSSRQRSRQKRKGEQDAIKKAFPNTTQVLFAPMWDSSHTAFTHAVFVFTSDETRALSQTTDLTFLNSFCSTIMKECSLLEAMLSDKQKSDFVSTISHEMRSPLHGLLASAEFLEDSDLTDFQNSLVRSISACGTTLKQTIDHVLDYSKINSFIADAESANRAKGGVHTPGKDYLVQNLHGAPPLLQLSVVTDLSAVLEEVIDAITLGETYTSGLDITDISREARGRGANAYAVQAKETVNEAVEVILDIQEENWMFMTQPGAIRRIFLNIFGNAVKYTSTGAIQVKLELQNSSETDADTEIMILTVTDTGKGISSDFLKSRIFLPFAQENSLAPGTGLGLSIVRSIVTMLGGDIEITSQVGKGTSVRVVLPLRRSLPGTMSTKQTPSSSGSSAPDNSLNVVRDHAGDFRIALCAFDDRPSGPRASEKLRAVLTRYVRDWFGLQLVDLKMESLASIIIVEDKNLDALAHRMVGTPGAYPAFVVLCSVVDRNSRELIQKTDARINGTVEFITKPCGPYKLARGIRRVMERERSRPARTSTSTLGPINEQKTPETPFLRGKSSSRKSQAQFQEMGIRSNGNSKPTAMVQGNEILAASQTSENAQMAINDPTSSADGSSAGEGTEKDRFPFPLQNAPALLSQQSMFDTSGAPNESTALTKHLMSVPSTPSIADAETANPRILLVDDNMINLGLLQAYLKKKRRYNRVQLAEDGLQAINAVNSAEEAFDVIFMDISMPVMNGFEATRAIRDFEIKSNAKHSAMIVALTGLASGRDQSEGFDSGCDIYMTKPVSFKEVGKLLDNWEAHQKLKDAKYSADGQELHGGVTEAGLVCS